MIHGAHVVIYSTDAEADRAFLRDVLKFSHVDAGGGWLIFALPQSEVAVHPADANGRHEFFLICEDIQQFIGAMKGKGVACSSIHEQPWGSLVEITLPGGGKLGVYQAKHRRPA